MDQATEAADIIAAARARGERSLSEYDSKRVLAAYGIPVTREALVADLDAACAAAAGIGWPVALKACAADLTHKTERGLVELGIADAAALAAAWERLRAEADGAGGVLVQEMVAGARELVLGLMRDTQAGPAVMFGIGGIFTEVFEDVTFRLAPLSRADALAMLDEIRGRRILDAIRGMAAVDRTALADAAVALGRIGLDHAAIREIDVNPLIIRGSRPVAVDALVVLEG